MAADMSQMFETYDNYTTDELKKLSSDRRQLSYLDREDLYELLNAMGDRL